MKKGHGRANGSKWVWMVCIFSSTLMTCKPLSKTKRARSSPWRLEGIRAFEIIVWLGRIVKKCYQDIGSICVTYPNWLSIITNSELMSKYSDDGSSFLLNLTAHSNVFCLIHVIKVCVHTNRLKPYSLNSRKFNNSFKAGLRTRIQLIIGTDGGALPANYTCIGG